MQVPASVLKAKNVNVSIKRKHIAVSCQAANDKSERVLVDSDLMWEVNVEESLWSLVPGNCIHVSR